jgi:hypothetical protein
MLFINAIFLKAMSKGLHLNNIKLHETLWDGPWQIMWKKHNAKRFL